MPYSTQEGKTEFLLPAVLDLNTRGPVSSVLDIGPGSGTYADLLRPRLSARFTAIEIFEPYVSRFRLNRKYDEIILGDAREVEFPDVDLVILGDVLEHMEVTDALTVWDKARGAARLGVLLSLPIVVFEQGCVDGNEHEAHLHHWTHNEVLTLLPGIYKSWTGSIVGCYLGAPTD
jgi:SAM-dependent methyltransferase